MRMIWLLMILFGTACQEPPVEPAVDAGVVTPADAGVVRCGTARAEFPEGLVELSWDDGEIGTSPYTAMDLSFMTSEYTATQGSGLCRPPPSIGRRFALSSSTRLRSTRYAYGSRRSVICVKTTSTPSVCTAILATTALILTAGTRSGRAPAAARTSGGTNG